LKTTAKRKTYKMVLYQRDLSRKLADQDSAVAQLQEALGADWDIEVSDDFLVLLLVRRPCSHSSCTGLPCSTVVVWEQR
jgi:hypothetical protein